MASSHSSALCELAAAPCAAPLARCFGGPDATRALLSRHLHTAIERHDVAAARSLLSQGADPLWLNDEQETAMHAGAISGHVDGLRLLLDECGLAPDCNPGATLEYSWLGPDTPLMHAAESGHLGASRLLLERHADVNYRSFSPEGVRFSVLLAAVEAGHLSVVMLLSSYGAMRHWLHGYSASSGNQRPISSEEREAETAGWERLRLWLTLSREWTPLHHIEVLTEARTRQLLREGGDVRCGSARCGTPAQRARQLLSAPPPDAPPDAAAAAVARLILLADEPWSPEGHDVRPLAKRERARDVLYACYAIKRELEKRACERPAGAAEEGGEAAEAAGGGGYHGLVDVWVGGVIPLVLEAEDGTDFADGYVVGRWRRRSSGSSSAAAIAAASSSMREKGEAALEIL